MTSRSVFRLLVTLALILAVAGGYGVFTAKAGTRSPSSALGIDNALPSASPLETPKKVVNLQGLSLAALPVATFVVIDGTTIRCPSSCSYGTDNWQQIQSSATSNWTIGTYVDGLFVGQGGPFLGPASTDYTGGSWSDFASGYGAGNHLIQTWVYMRDAAATAYHYNYNYTIYTP
jgi:hypothetical protein